MLPITKMKKKKISLKTAKYSEPLQSYQVPWMPYPWMQLQECDEEEEQEKEDTGSTTSDEECTHKTKKAWKLPQEKSSNVALVPMLMVIGK